MTDKPDITPGPWYISELRRNTFGPMVYAADRRVVADCGRIHRRTRGETEANAELVAEVGTVYHETGLTPRQLLEQLIQRGKQLQQRDDLLRKLLTEREGRYSDPRTWQEVENLFASTPYINEAGTITAEAWAAVNTDLAKLEGDQ